MHLYKSLRILLEEKNKLKNGFLHKKREMLLSSCLESDLKRFPVQLWSPNANLVHNQGSNRHITYFQIGCAFGYNLHAF